MIAPHDGKLYRGPLRLPRACPLLRSVHTVIDGVAQHMGERGPKRRPSALGKPEPRRLSAHLYAALAQPHGQALDVLAKKREALLRRLEFPGRAGPEKGVVRGSLAQVIHERLVLGRVELELPSARELGPYVAHAPPQVAQRCRFFMRRCAEGLLHAAL